MQLEYDRKTKIKYFSKVKIRSLRLQRNSSLGFFFLLSAFGTNPEWELAHPQGAEIPEESQLPPGSQPKILLCASPREEHQVEDITTFQGIVSCLAHLICHSIALWAWARHSTRSHLTMVMTGRCLSFWVTDFQGIICYFTPENYDNITQAVLNAPFPHQIHHFSGGLGHQVLFWFKMYTGEMKMSWVYYLCTHLLLTKRINCTWKSMQSSVAFKQAAELNRGPIKADNPWLNQTHGQGHPKWAACEMHPSKSHTELWVLCTPQTWLWHQKEMFSLEMGSPEECEKQVLLSW